jgi:tetratricopeptide (TPR) repeat protein
MMGPVSAETVLVASMSGRGLADDGPRRSGAQPRRAPRDDGRRRRWARGRCPELGAVRGVGLALVLTLSSVVAVAAPPVPPLPELPLDTYEAAIRKPIAEAYAAARANPDDPDRSGYLGMVLYAHEQYEFAEPCFERARGLAPREARWAYYLGRAQVYLAHLDRAVSSLREALRLRPGYLPAQVMLAQALLDAGRVDESLALYEELAKTHPETPEVHYGLGRIHADRGELDAAVEHFGRACDLFPAFGAAHFALARAYRARGEGEKAREQLALYQRDKDGWPTLPDPFLEDVVALRTSATDHLRRGIDLATKGQLQEAAREHEEALAVDPKLVQAHVNLIRIYGQLGQPEKAEAHYRSALAIDPNLAETHYNYGVLLTGEGRSSEAAAAFRRAIELKPTYAEAQNNYAYFLMTSGDLEGARRHYETAIELKPDYRAAHFNLARILGNQGKYEEAIVHLRRTLLPDDEETPRCAYALAVALSRAGHLEEALIYMREAREKAKSLGQSALLASAERDLGVLERAAGAR